MLKQNYQGAKTDQEIEQIYAQSLSLEPDDVAKVIETAVQNKLTQVTILPNEKT
jgi:hypothetical protein